MDCIEVLLPEHFLIISIITTFILAGLCPGARGVDIADRNKLHALYIPDRLGVHGKYRSAAYDAYSECFHGGKLDYHIDTFASRSFKSAWHFFENFLKSPGNIKIVYEAGYRLTNPALWYLRAFAD